MGQNSKISWTHHTFNPWIGCTKVSDGCKFCYAESLMDHRWNKVKWGPKGERQRTTDSNWRQPIKWNTAAEKAGRRDRVFCASLADVFEDRDELKPWRRELFDLICRTPSLDWLVLTKRPENALVMMVEAGLYAVANPDLPRPQENLWIGTSCEDQESADERIPHLLKCPAAVRFLSCEPLLSAIDLTKYIGYNPMYEDIESRDRGLSSRDYGVDKNRTRRVSLEGGGIARESLESSRVTEKNYSTTGREVVGTIHACSMDEQGCSDTLPSAQAGMASFSGANSTTETDKPFERRQARQSTREFGIDYGEREQETFLSDRDARRTRREESCGQADGFSGSCNPTNVQERIQDPSKDSHAIPSMPSNHLTNSSWGQQAEAGGADGKLCESAGTGDSASSSNGQIHLVITGCESGPGRRPFEQKWDTDIQEQCRAAGVAFFRKQIIVNGKVSADPSDWAPELRTQEFPEVSHV